MREHSFVVPIRPKPKGRPRRSKHGGVFTPQDTAIYEGAVADAYTASGGPRFDGQVEVNILFKPTESTVTIRESDHGKSPVRGDVDNLGKAVLDSLNGVAWTDDVQVTVLRLVKGR